MDRVPSDEILSEQGLDTRGANGAVGGFRKSQCILGWRFRPLPGSYGYLQLFIPPGLEVRLLASARHKSRSKIYQAGVSTVIRIGHCPRCSA